MTDERMVAEQDSVDDEDPRRQLWIRAGVAGGLIAMLLGGLAVFDHLSRPPQPAEVLIPTKPIAPARVSPDVGRDMPPDVLRAGTPGPQAPAAEVPPLPAEEVSAAPALPAGERRGPDERGAKAEREGRLAEGTRPPLRHPAHPAPAAPLAVAPAPPPETSPRPAPQAAPASRAAAPLAAAPAQQLPVPAVPASAAAKLAAAAPTEEARSPAAGPVSAKPRAPAAADVPAGYVLQVGVFQTTAQAEALRARLLAEGIPSRLETRVVVGPFVDRREAQAAQARLREKGFVAGELIPFRR